ncbi:hypothetical protein BDM02DRAFT_3130985 [Thelephora ganbajun]|uniref:Uncharacterized protein n=1 Tax=Thelephora ganbajun TaxID=370292 RepID=A0ACB6Z7P4_THEGA|nr:hypothetical protein BDM02DRAFT_3130985 [Thelephora ganbajun]
MDKTWGDLDLWDVAPRELTDESISRIVGDGHRGKESVGRRGRNGPGTNTRRCALHVHNPQAPRTSLSHGIRNLIVAGPPPRMLRKPTLLGLPSHPCSMISANDLDQYETSQCVDHLHTWGFAVPGNPGTPDASHNAQCLMPAQQQTPPGIDCRTDVVKKRVRAFDFILRFDACALRTGGCGPASWMVCRNMIFDLSVNNATEELGNVKFLDRWSRKRGCRFGVHVLQETSEIEVIGIPRAVYDSDEVVIHDIGVGKAQSREDVSKS